MDGWDEHGGRNWEARDKNPLSRDLCDEVYLGTLQ